MEANNNEYIWGAHSSGGLKWKGPEEISRTDKDYLELCKKMTVAESENLCMLLLNPYEKIFDSRNNRHDWMVDGKHYHVGGSSRDVLESIADGEYTKDEILYDIAMLVTDKDLREKALRFLDEGGFIKLISEEEYNTFKTKA